MASEARNRQFPIILALGTTQTLAWASSYYLPAILADPIGHDLGMSANWIFAAFSAALVISALLGPRIGRQIDLLGGRPVLCTSNLTIAAGLVLLGISNSIPLLVVAWILLGIGMGYGLYDAAFAALGRIYGDAARGPITGITLMAGFASTVGWPLTAFGLDHIGWRDTCFAWAAAHILIGLPLNFFMLPKVTVAKAEVANAIKPHIPIDRSMILLAFTFAAGWTVTGAMAAHMPRILEAGGATAVQAVAAAALFGPAQVFARILEATLLKRYHPLLSTKLACLTHPIGAAIFSVVGGTAAGAFSIFFGMGNGVLTIARGTLPLAIFGPKDYGYRLGLIGAPARMAQAAAPLAFGLLIDLIGLKVLIVSSALSLSALAALLMLRPDSDRAATDSESS
jgi:predicted MFS family arabinose efflux permease